MLHDHTTIKSSARKRLLELVYGLEAKLHIHLQIRVLQLMQNVTTKQDTIQTTIDQLVELEESIHLALDQMTKNQRKM
jgi:hypothetical protein